MRRCCNMIAIPLAVGVLASRGFVLSLAMGAVLMSASPVIVAIDAYCSVVFACDSMKPNFAARRDLNSQPSGRECRCR